MDSVNTKMPDSAQVGSPRRVLFASGGHAKVIFDAARAMGWDFDSIIDDRPSKEPFMGQVVESATVFEKANAAAFRFVVGIGNNNTRKRKFEWLIGLGGEALRVTHPSAVISNSSRVGSGSVVFANGVVNPGSDIGENVVINTAVSVDHDCLIGNHAQLCPGVHLSGGVTIGECSFVGVGACVIEGSSIGKNSIVGAGAVVTRDIPDGVVAYGCPARVVRRVEVP